MAASVDQDGLPVVLCDEIGEPQTLAVRNYRDALWRVMAIWKFVIQEKTTKANNERVGGSVWTIRDIDTTSFRK